MKAIDRILVGDGDDFDRRRVGEERRRTDRFEPYSRIFVGRRRAQQVDRFRNPIAPVARARGPLRPGRGSRAT